MDLYELEFAKIFILRDDIAEVIVNEGVEMNEAMVDEYHEFLITHLQAPFSLLVNKLNSYTYDFNAQRKLATIKQINVMAIVAYNHITSAVTEALAKFPRDTQWKLQVFSDRDTALRWLISQQENK
ncbi:MAG: hypothetical protein OQL06_15275 [Gammaproteobacteria bacterium]|nr:hypothetical protein [Gammaproteobacteria bacterium]